MDAPVGNRSQEATTRPAGIANVHFALGDRGATSPGLPFVGLPARATMTVAAMSNQGRIADRPR
jgi:hypothetical protein